MTEPAADASALLTEQDSLVLASMASAVEVDLVTAWLEQQRAGHPGAQFELVKLPALDAPPAEMTALAERLEAGDDRSVVPVRVFWLPPPDRGRIAKLAGLVPGRDPYHPNQRLQAQILRRAPQRARVVAGERPPSPNCAASGATPPSATTSATSPNSSSAAPSWRWSGSNTGYWARNTSRRGW